MELEDLIENYFAPTRENFSFDKLLEMVEGALDLDPQMLAEQTQQGGDPRSPQKGIQEQKTSHISKNGF